jgi:sec-independent protein translocase protein TatA
MFGISPMQLVIILVIVVLLFGTKKLRGLGGDLGSAMKGFKKAMGDDDKEQDADFAIKEKVEDKSVIDTGDAKSAKNTDSTKNAEKNAESMENTQNTENAKSAENAEKPVQPTKSEHKESN